MTEEPAGSDGPDDSGPGASSRDDEGTPPAQAIEAEALTKVYGRTIAVEDLDLWIPRGSVYGFLGPNGAGKTTTMEMLTTLVSPTSGSARVLGESIEHREAVVDHVGYLPEEPPLHEELTAREQLRYVAGLRDMDPATADDRIEARLEALGLTDDADRRIGEYSKGMKQKTGIVQALLHDPAVVFLDEPTSGLDPRAARTVRNTIADLADEAGTTVFLSTHILSVVDELADTVGVLSNGRLVTEGSPAALKRRAEAGRGGTLEDVFIEVTGGPDDPADGTASGIASAHGDDGDGGDATPVDTTDQDADGSGNGDGTRSG